MIILFSHALAFSVLLVASIYDLKTSEVPDIISFIGIGGGLLLHLAYSLYIGSFNPLMWSIGVGLIFFAYGWAAYIRGMWGGADALALAVLGFAAPFSLDGIGIRHALDLFINLMIVGLFYSLIYTFYKSLSVENFFSKLFNIYIEEKFRVILEISVAMAFSLFVHFQGLNGALYFFLFLFLILLYRYMKVVENTAFTKSVKVEDLEGGEVLDEQYSDKKIRGVSKEELKSLDVDVVEVKDGIRFLPVFPIALFLTDVFTLGLDLFQVLAVT